jgi:hypothetical protein
MDKGINGHLPDTVFQLLDGRLMRTGAPSVRLVLCGGTALIAEGFVVRVTTDADIVAFIDDSGRLTSPAPMPSWLLKAAGEVADTLNLPENWLNNGPSCDEGGLFQMGLPEGFLDRLHKREYGSRLTIYFADRFDLIHIKLYAAVDRGGYHISDLLALRPTPHELALAARWAFTHDVSPGFHDLMKRMLLELGHADVAENL